MRRSRSAPDDASSLDDAVPERELLAERGLDRLRDLLWPLMRLPAPLARCWPALTRETIICRSTLAKAPETWKNIFPEGVEVSR